MLAITKVSTYNSGEKDKKRFGKEDSKAENEGTETNVRRMTEREEKKKGGRSMGKI